MGNQSHGLRSHLLAHDEGGPIQPSPVPLMAIQDPQSNADTRVHAISPFAFFCSGWKSPRSG
ncbi:hypothetical protein, partial [Pseudomonas aeruginosa]|uniref:hypothetical protein n=1 Tax=Pseudomonas aeruginosa TaxID=287 RepID=UPI001C697948